MQLRTIAPRAEIAPFIHHFWVFRSEAGLPQSDARVVVPNGRAKLIIPWRNGLSATGAGTAHPAREGEIVVIGLWDQPSTLSSPPAHTVTIGIEFKPSGLARFVAEDLDALHQRIIPIEQCLGRDGSLLVSRINSADSLDEAVEQTQAFLLERLASVGRPPRQLVDEALRMMAESGFSIEITELAERLDCSRRHLQEAFRRQIGLPPKRVQAVLGFESLYRRFSRDKDARLLRDEALDLYFDQAHFIHTFRRFTGYTPGRFAEIDNEFGRIFYRS